MTPRMRLAWLRARRLVAGSGLRFAMLLVPPRAQAVVAGLPDAEENSLSTAAMLAETYRGEVVLVAADPAAARRLLDHVAEALGVGSAAVRVRIVAKDAPASIVAFVRSNLVFYTHGLFDSPRPVGARVHVNLWHGTGPKWNTNANVTQRIGADVLAAASPVWGAEVATSLTMPPGTRLVTGNPRQDVMLAPPPRERLAALELDPRRPLVLWLPTFRQSARAGRVGLREGVPLTSAGTGDPPAARFALMARDAGVQLVLKTHRNDDDDYAALGLRTLSTDDVLAAGMTTYQLLGLADAVLSDYSSVWVDFLATGRSVGLYCPDLDEYRRERGLNAPDLSEVAPGLVVDEAGVGELFEAVAAGRVFRRDALAGVAAALRVDVQNFSRTRAMLADVAEVARRRYGTTLGLTATSS